MVELRKGQLLGGRYEVVGPICESGIKKIYEVSDRKLGKSLVAEVLVDNQGISEK